MIFCMLEENSKGKNFEENFMEFYNFYAFIFSLVPKHKNIHKSFFSDLKKLN